MPSPSLLKCKSELICLKSSQRLLITLRIQSKLSTMAYRVQYVVAFTCLLKCTSCWSSPYTPAAPTAFFCSLNPAKLIPTSSPPHQLFPLLGMLFHPSLHGCSFWISAQTSPLQTALPDLQSRGVCLQSLSLTLSNFTFFTGLTLSKIILSKCFIY